MLFLVTAGLFITWLFRAHRSDRMYRAQLQHASGWAIGGWFVPILNLWRPAQMVLDVRRGASDTGWSPTALVLSWWWFLLVAGVLQRVANALAPSADAAFGSYVEDVRRYLVVDAAASVLLQPPRSSRSWSCGARPGWSGTHPTQWSRAPPETA